MAWTNATKPSSENTYLLMEDGYYLLQEDGSKIVLTRSADWSNTTKPSGSWSNATKPTSSWTNTTKP